MKEVSIITGQLVKQETLERAKELRHRMTPQESALWHRLKANRLSGFHFRRQQVIDGYIVDFYCHAVKLVVEVDRPIHRQQKDYDEARDCFLEECGLRVLRFQNDDVDKNIEYVLQRILEGCANQPDHPPRVPTNLTPQPPSLMGRGSQADR